jgi:DNA primase
VVVLHESDAAAVAQAVALTKEIAALGVQTCLTVLPTGKSVNAIAREASDPVAALRAIVPQVGEEQGAASSEPVSVTIPVLDNTPAGPSALAVTVMKHGAEETVLACGDRTYRVRGLARNSGYESLRISLRITCGSTWHLDALDLTQARQRAAFISAAADETGLKPELLKRDVGRVLLKLEELHEERLLAQVAPEPAITMTPVERAAALDLLRDPNLWD